MAKKISDLTATVLAPGDEIEIYRPGSPALDLRAPLPLAAIESLSILPLGVGIQPAIASAGLIEDLPTGDVASVAGKYGDSAGLTGVAQGSSPALPQRLANGRIRVVSNGATLNNRIQRNDALLTARWCLTVEAVIDVAANWGGQAVLMGAADTAVGYGAYINKTSTGVKIIQMYGPNLFDVDSITGISAGRQTISMMIDHSATPATWRVAIRRLDEIIFENGTFAQNGNDPIGETVTLHIGNLSASAGHLGTHDYGGHRLLSGIPAGLSANDLDALMLREIEILARDLDPSSRLNPKPPATVTTLTETGGAVDLVLQPDQHNYFLNAVSLAGELVWNLPAANDWIGTEVTAMRTGGGEFDLVLAGSTFKLRKGQVGIAVSDGVSWKAVENRLDWFQVRETANVITATYDTHSGKIIRATANTNTTIKLKDTSPTQSTFWVMSHSGPARTMTFQPADTTDGDGTSINGTLGGSVVFQIPLNTPMMFLAYAELNAGGTLAQYIVMAFGPGTGSGSATATEAAVLGVFNPATPIAITTWEGVYSAYSQGGTVSPSLNVAGSTINGGTVLIPWTNNNHTVNWNANLVDFRTKINADIRTSWNGLRMVLIRFDEPNGRGEVIFADVDATEVIATPGGGLAGVTVQAQLAELDSEKLSKVAAGAVLSDVELKDVAETFFDAGVKTGATTLDYTAGGMQQITTGGSNITSMAITNPPATGRVGTLLLKVVQGATARTIAWGAAFRFAGGADATLTASAGAIDFFTLLTHDGGATWFVFEGGLAFAA